METYISENGQFVTHRDLSRFAEMVDERFLAIEQELLDSSFAKEFIIKDGQKVEADLAYIEIYQQAKKSLIMIDGYISLKTLHLLSHVSNGVKITIITEKNPKHKDHLTKSEWQDFRNQFPDVDIRFVDLQHRVHDRYIVVDFGDKQEKLYLSGPSSKDAGTKIGMMIRVSDIEPMRIIIEQLMKHPVFIIH